jgi:hypothetical protein
MSKDLRLWRFYVRVYFGLFVPGLTRNTHVGSDLSGDTVEWSSPVGIAKFVHV